MPDNIKLKHDLQTFLFDEELGLSKEIQEFLYNITEENANDFARNYLIKTDEEWKNFYNSKRTLESYQTEFDCLKEIYQNKKIL